MDKKYPTVLFVSSYSVAFILRDIALLKKHYNLLLANFVGVKKTITDFFKVITTVYRKFNKADLAFIWFADFRACVTVVIGKLLKKPTILIIGGYEVAKVPEISYGGALSRISRVKTRWILQHAEIVVSVSKASQKELQQNLNYSTSKLIYNGVEIDKFNINKAIHKEKIAITVGRITKSNLMRKGIEPFVRAAAYLPDIPFYVIGKFDTDVHSFLRTIASENVIFTGFISEEELIGYYQRAKVYVQASAHEAFGISLAEAMLCECIPVITDRGALPEVAGGTGFVIPFNDPKAVADAIEKALLAPTGSSARKHIMKNFSMRCREVVLKNMIDRALCR